MTRLCIIPARAGSKRIPHKNVKDFCGKPMIAHTIEAVKASDLFDIIHISTDSDEVTKVATQMDVAPDFKRPAELADDHSTMMDVVRHVVLTYAEQGKEFDTVCLVYATSPLIDPEDLKSACAAIENSDQDKALLAVAPFPAPLDQAFTLNKDNDDLNPFNESGLSQRTQDLQQGYYDAGMFCFYSSAYVKKQTGAGDFTQFRGYIVPSWRVTDIDWPEDWEHAEKMFQVAQQS